MKVAGDAGALLRIELDISETLAEARSHPEAENTPVDRAGTATAVRQVQADVHASKSSKSRLTFGNLAEERLIDALRRFATDVQNDGGFRRRLFAEDAARGLRFR